MKRLISLGAGMVFFLAGFLGGYVFTRQSETQPDNEPIVSAPREGTYRVSRVLVGDTLVNEALIREGFARYFAVKGEAVPKYRDRFLYIEAEAKEGHRGLWMDAWEKAP